MVNDINAVQSIVKDGLLPARSERGLSADQPKVGANNPGVDTGHDQSEVTREAIEVAGEQALRFINAVSDKDLSFSIDNDINRMIVVVRTIGSEEIVRQFPPEEFITVAKFIAAQNPSEIDQDFLKGLLFDERG